MWQGAQQPLEKENHWDLVDRVEPLDRIRIVEKISNGDFGHDL